MPSTIAGTITDPQGNPIAGATIAISIRYIDGKKYHYLHLEKYTGMTQLTDADGQFMFDHLPDGAMISMTVSHKDYAFYSTKLAYPDRDDYLISANDRDINITMEPGGSIKGKFIYEDGRPYKDKSILLYIADSSNNMILEQTDADGTFQTCALPENTYMVKPLSASIAKQKFFCRTLTDVKVSLETGATEIEMIVQKPLPVTVTIFDSESGQPLKNIIVSAILNYIYERKGSVPEASERTDEQGKCTLMLAPDKYRITARGHKDDEYHDFTQELVVTADSENLSAEFEITPPDMVWGTLTDSQGSPIQGTVSLGSHNCKTDESGNFELSLEWARDNKTHIGFAIDKTKSLSAAFLWNKNDNIYDLQLNLDKPASITGQMTDPEGNPIKNASIALHIIMGDGTTTGLGEHQWSQKVNPDGTFIVNNIPTGLDYQVFAERPGWQGLQDVLDIEPQQKADIGNLTLKPTRGYEFDGDIDWTGVLNGTVIDEFKRPIPGLMVSVDIGTSDFIESRTDIKGRFTLKNLPKGRSVSFSTFVLAGYGSRHVQKIVDGTDLEIQIFPQGWDLIDKPAPGIYVEKWLNIDDDITLEDYKGYVTLLQIDVNLPSYSDDLKLTNKMLDKYRGKGFEVIAIHQRKPIGPNVENTEQYILDYLAGYDIDFPLGLDAKWSTVSDFAPKDSPSGNAMHALYRVKTKPAFYLIDKNGILRISPKRNELEDWIKQLLDE